MKKRQLNMFGKSFAISVGMLVIIVFTAYLLVYLLLPPYYKNFKTQQYISHVNQRLPLLEQVNTLNEEILFLNQLFAELPASVTLLDEDHHELYRLGKTLHSINLQTDENFLENDTNSGEWTHVISAGTMEFLPLEFEYTTHKESRLLQVSIPLEPLSEARNVIIDIYPVAVLVCVVFSLMIAFLFSYWIVVPIKKIRQATAKMVNLEPNVFVHAHRKDEIGELSQDISKLYEQLRTTILNLEKEINKYSDSENRKIEFLQTVSHEMKTPLAAANALIEGILYEVAPYHENPKKYLEECRCFLEKTILLTKESLSLSEEYKEEESLFDCVTLINEMAALYGVIFKSKQISYSQTVPTHIFILSKRNLFEKVLSNLFSNAGNHTPNNGLVHVEYANGILSIKNTCQPLLPDEVTNLFEPLATQKANKLSTGLGLYIVRQLLRQLQIKFIFAPTTTGKGMVFKLDIHGFEK